MRFSVLTIAALAALASSVAMTAVTPAAEAAPKSAKVSKSKPLTGTIYGNRRRPGGYSFKKADVISGGPAGDPAAQGYYPSGAIDGDFFFPRASGPFGGYTSYMH